MPTQRPTGTFISGKSSKQSVVLWSSASRMSRWVRCDICITGRLTPACRVRGRQQHWYVTKNPHRWAFNLLLPALEAFYLFFGRIVSVFMYLCWGFFKLVLIKDVENSENDLCVHDVLIFIPIEGCHQQFILIIDSSVNCFLNYSPSCLVYKM